MIDALVYPDLDGFHVRLYLDLDHKSFDDAGPFDDVTDAVLMAERSVWGGGIVRVMR